MRFNMTFELAKEDGNFWSDYYENIDERSYYGDETYTPKEFYRVWLKRSEFEKTVKKENKE
tara:strand:+ start:935 stop:1117 length:183 start_codon:yes stop_codon:yes gene_type:complete